MAEISKQTLWDIRKEAREYLISLKGEHLTDEEIIHAENLMVFGYHWAMEELESELKGTNTQKENIAIINSQWT
ncbi:MAG: hypothetical protein K8H86_10810 [Ignavibacteriaceae bacterium]|nr:hypothetical protein [Ignavibacteriaceae bacterium]